MTLKPNQFQTVLWTDTCGDCEHPFVARTYAGLMQAVDDHVAHVNHDLADPKLADPHFSIQRMNRLIEA